MSETQELALGDYLDVLRRRFPWIILTFLAVLGLVAAFTFTREPTYRASADVLILTESNEGLFDYPDQVEALLTRPPLQELQYLESGDFKTAARAEAAISGRYTVTAEQFAQTPDQDADTIGIIRFVALAGDADDAAKAANAFATTYIEQTYDRNLREYTRLRGQEDATVEFLDGAIAAQNLAKVTAQSEAEAAIVEGDTVKLSAATQALERADARLRDLAEDYDTASEKRRSHSGVVAALESTEAGDRVGSKTNRSAVANPTPISPDVPRNLILGGVAGLVLGLVVAVSSDFLANRNREEDIEVVAGLPVLSAVGDLPTDLSSPGGVRPFSALTHHEASGYRVLLNSISLIQMERPTHSIAFTSGQPDVGKTQTVVNLAQAEARRGTKVIVVDTDGVNPSAAERIGLPRAGFGLGDLLEGATSLDAAINETDTPNLDIIDASSAGHYGGDLPQAEKLGLLLNKLRDRYDLVLLDCAPVLSSADPRIITSQADATVLVYDPAVTRQPELLHAISLLEGAHANIIGLVANRSDQSHPLYHEGYGNSGGYGYGNGAKRNSGNRVPVSLSPDASAEQLPPTSAPAPAPAPDSRVES